MPLPPCRCHIWMRLVAKVEILRGAQEWLNGFQLAPTMRARARKLI
jgi:hypothetical protein